MNQNEHAENKQLKRDEGGTVTGVLSSARDITKQKGEYERLQQIEGLWVAITESTQDAILMMDTEGSGPSEFFFINRRFTRKEVAHLNQLEESVLVIQRTAPGKRRAPWL